jgi:DNA repair photolyase
MLSHYCGGFLVNPMPLHYGLNWCSHNCFYCFANLNKPDRRSNNASIKKFNKALNFSDETIEGHLIRAKMPILMSNDSDPCAKSNEGVFLPVYEEITRHGIKVAVQTKGGNQRVEDILLNGEKTMFYISLTSDDNDFLKKAEPGAPSYEYRLNLISNAVLKGHFVIVGINPLVERWWNDFDRVIDDLIRVGVKHIWVDDAHLTPDQVKNIPDKRRQHFFSDIKVMTSRAYFFAEHLKKQLEVNFNVYQGGISSRGDFWSDYYNIVGDGYETTDGLLAHLNFNANLFGVDDLILSFDSFCDFFIHDSVSDLKNSKFKELIKPFRRTVYNETKEEPKIYTMGKALYYFWQINKYKSSMSVDNFSYLSEGGVISTDDNGNHFLVYSKKPKADIFFENNESLILI